MLGRILYVFIFLYGLSVFAEYRVYRLKVTKYRNKKELLELNDSEDPAKKKLFEQNQGSLKGESKKYFPVEMSFVNTTLDQYQYTYYYPTGKLETIDLVDSWMCWGRHYRFDPLCPSPRAASYEKPIQFNE